MLEHVDRRAHEIVDGRAAHRHDAYAATQLDEVMDQVRTAVGLAGSRWSLDGDDALVKVVDPGIDLIETLTEDAVAWSGPRREPGGLGA